jgi:hypothetical protein
MGWDYAQNALRAPRKISVGQKSATVGTCSAHESHVLVRVRNWIFRGALKGIAMRNYWMREVPVKAKEGEIF